MKADVRKTRRAYTGEGHRVVDGKCQRCAAGTGRSCPVAVVAAAALHSYWLTQPPPSPPKQRRRRNTLPAEPPPPPGPAPAKSAVSYRMLTAARRAIQHRRPGCPWCADTGRTPTLCVCEAWCGRSDCRAVDGWHDPGGADSE